MFRNLFRKFAGAGSRRAVRLVTRTAVRNTRSKKLLGAAIGLGLAGLALTSVAAAQEEVPYFGQPGTVNERTFIAVKPDGVQRGLVGEIIKRFESKGYRLVAIKMIQPTTEFAAQHYDDLKSKPFFGGLVKFFSSGPVVAMVWQGKGVIAGGRRLLGATNPDDSAPGTIRGDLCVVVGRNVCHGSDSADSAKDEIKLWFTEKEVNNWRASTHEWVYESK